jgi:hypothetical protein
MLMVNQSIEYHVMWGMMVAQSRSTYAPGGRARRAIKGKIRSATLEQIYDEKKTSRKMEKINELWVTIPIQDAVNINKSMSGTTDMTMDDILHPHLSGEEENP